MLRSRSSNIGRTKVKTWTAIWKTLEPWFREAIAKERLVKIIVSRQQFEKAMRIMKECENLLQQSRAGA
jgi:hypothetical protein